MTTQKKSMKYAWQLAIGILVGAFLMGMLSGVKKQLTENKAQAIEAVLKKHCECEEIVSFLYTQGIQYDKNEGLTTERAEFELKNCAYRSLAQEAFRINKLLIDNVTNYKDLDYLTLEFVGPDLRKSVIIKNGVIQSSKKQNL